MSKLINQTFRLTILAAALTSVYGTALANDKELQLQTQPESSISAGVGNWSGDRSQQGIYDDMREGKAYGLLDLSVIKRDEATGTWMTFIGSNLGLDTRELSAEWLRQGDIGVTFELNRTPRVTPNTFNTGLLGIGTTYQTISGAGASALPKRDVTLGTERDLLGLGIYKNLMPGLDFRVSFKNETKEGNRPWGLGTNALFMAEPIDSTIRQLEMTLDYTAKRLQLQGGYYGSWYETDNTLVWGLVNGAATPGADARNPNPTPLSQPLDNQAHQFYLNGGYTFTPTTRGTFKLAYSIATQDESLPSRGLTAPNNAFNGAPSSLDGEIKTTNVVLGLTSQPLPKLSLLANLRYYNVDDQTPLVGIVGNNTTGAISVHNTPHSIETTSGKLEATYRLPDNMSLVGGVDISQQDRSSPQFVSERFVPFRKKLDEETYRLQLRRSMSETVNGSIAYLHSKRDGSEFLATEHFPSDYINPTNIADRKRDKWRLSMDWAPMEQFSLQGVIEDSSDKYGNNAGRPFGLRDGNATLLSLDASYAFNENWNMTAWISQDKTKARLLGARWDRVTENYEVDKESHLKDVGKSLGLGLRGNVSGKLKIGADMQLTRNNSDYLDTVTTNGPGSLLPDGGIPGGTTSRGTVALPNIENKLAKLNLFAIYAIQKNADIRVDLIHERWQTDDWTWKFSNGAPFTYGTTTDGTSVTTDPKQVSNFASIRYIYRFQ